MSSIKTESPVDHKIKSPKTHIEINREELLKILPITTNIINDRKTIPVLGHILLQIDEKMEHLILCTTDLRMSVKCKVPAIINRAFSVTVPGKKFHQIIKEISDETVHLSIENENNIVIESQSGSFKIMGLSHEEFPSLHFFDEEGISFKQSVFQDALKKALISICHDISRPVLNGVYFEIQKDKLIFVGTDGRRLSWVKIDLEVPLDIEKRFIIPGKVAQELVKVLKKEGTFCFYMADRVIGFECDDCHYFTQLVEGQYPQFEKVIPDQIKDKVEISSELFLSAFRRATILIDDKLNRIKINLSKNKLTVFSQNKTLGESEESIDIIFDGEDVNIGFSPYYFLDFFKVIDKERFFFCLTEGNKSALLKTDESFIYLVMPMRLI